MKKSKYLNIGRISIFALVIIIFWFLFFLRNFFCVNSKIVISDNLFIVLSILMVFILILFYYNILKLKKENNIPSIQRVGLIFVLLFFIIIHVIMCFSFYDKMGSIRGGGGSLYNKQEIGDSYYFFVKGNNNHIVKIECRKDIYDKLIVDENVLYVFTYRVLQYNPEKGVLERDIDTSYYIDNRGKGMN